MLWLLIKSASVRHFWVPIAYDFMEKQEKYQYFLVEKKTNTLSDITFKQVIPDKTENSSDYQNVS